MREVMDFIRTHDAFFVIGLAAAWLILLAYTTLLSRRMARLSKRREARLEEGRIEDVLDYVSENTRAVTDMRARVEELGRLNHEQSCGLTGCIQRVAMVRFNAFEDVGGEQSFAIALLDAQANGVVLSSLYGRQDSRLYAKTVIGGQGERPLSDEERRAVEKALNESADLRR